MRVYPMQTRRGRSKSDTFGRIGDNFIVFADFRPRFRSAGSTKGVDVSDVLSRSMLIAMRRTARQSPVAAADRAQTH